MEVTTPSRVRGMFDWLTPEELFYAFPIRTFTIDASARFEEDDPVQLRALVALLTRAP